MHRKEYIDKWFLYPALNKETLPFYVQRSALLAAVKECTPVLGGKLLDVGCGQMPYRELMLSLNQNINQYVGLDLQSSSVHDVSIADLHWDGETIPAEDNSFDSAMATEVLEHSFYPKKTLQEIQRVLKPGAVFFFTVPFVWPLHEVPYDAYRYTPFSLKLQLEEAGFENIVVKPTGGWHASFAQMLALWIQESGLKRRNRKWATKIALMLIPRLLKMDKKDSSFTPHFMPLGLYGTATKKQSA